MSLRSVFWSVNQAILTVIARFHPKNWKNSRRWDYPQLWYCWPRWAGNKKSRRYRLRTRICGFLTGHEISRTERGYGGGKYIDHNCRWCDLLIEVPIQESLSTLPELFWAIDEDARSE